MTTVKLTDYDPFPEQMSGETFTIDVDGKIFYVELWSTYNSSGLDIYDEEWELSDPPDDVVEIIDELIEEWRDAASAKWQEHVDPALRTAKAELLAEAKVKHVGT